MPEQNARLVEISQPRDGIRHEMGVSTGREKDGLAFTTRGGLKRRTEGATQWDTAVDFSVVGPRK